MKYYILPIMVIVFTINGCVALQHSKPRSNQNSAQYGSGRQGGFNKKPVVVNQPSNSSQQSGVDSYANFRQQCVNTINRYRATLNLPALKHWKNQESCVDNEAKSDSEVEKAHASMGRCGERAQNACPGWSSVQSTVTDCLKDMWNEGPGEPYSAHGHYINMTGQYTQVACGFYQTPSGEIWAIQNFQ